MTAFFLLAFPGMTQTVSDSLHLLPLMMTRLHSGQFSVHFPTLKESLLDAVRNTCGSFRAGVGFYPRDTGLPDK